MWELIVCWLYVAGMFPTAFSVACAANGKADWYKANIITMLWPIAVPVLVIWYVRSRK